MFEDYARRGLVWASGGPGGQFPRASTKLAFLKGSAIIAHGVEVSSKAAVLVVATGNQGKRAEFSRLLAGIPAMVADLSLAGPGYQAPPEDGETYADNARIKARAAAAATGCLALADDSGIEVAALGGRPGVHSARYGGPGLDDAGRVDHLLAALAQVPMAARDAEFVAHLAVAAPSGEIVAQSEARLAGRVALVPIGALGFGYDPIFIVPSIGETMAELAPAAKDVLSHRGRACALLVPQLRGLLLDFATTQGLH